MAFDVPDGWIAGGTSTSDYSMNVDLNVGRHGTDLASIQSTKNKVQGYGCLKKVIPADNYKGKRVRLTGFLKTNSVQSWAGLVIKAKGAITTDPITHIRTRNTLCWDNMSYRSLNGTIGFTKYEIVIDIPDSASLIAYGGRLTGGGQIWFDQLKLEIVGNDVPLTKPKLSESSNPDLNE